MQPISPQSAEGMTAHPGTPDDVLAGLLGAPFARGECTAVLDGDTAVSYGELDERVAAEVADMAAARPAPARVSASRDTDTMVAMLAALRAGVTYCPVDTALPARRRQQLMSLTGVGEPVGGEVPAYVLFTSGSSGTPKPVAVPRRALAATVPVLRTLFGLTPGDRVLQFAAPSWDTALEETLPTIAAGATVVFDREAYQGAFPQFLRAVARRGVTVLNMSTAWWHELVRYLSDESKPLPSCVRLVVIGGEPVNPGRLRTWRRLPIEHVDLLNTYGCTETTMITHAVALSGPSVQWQLPDSAIKVPLGRALPHVSDHLTATGELLLSGAGLASGYPGLPDQTAARFRTADRGDGPARWFHTGDLMVRDDTGLLYPVGRADDQVKVRGVRVHPAEVEAVLSTHPAVAASAVCGERRAGRTSLTAYVVLSGQAGATELRQYVREHLPDHFVPQQVHPVAALRFTATGKVDRSATRRSFAATEPGVQS